MKNAVGRNPNLEKIVSAKTKKDGCLSCDVNSCGCRTNFKETDFNEGGEFNLDEK